MKHVKILFFLAFCATVTLVAVQNAETLSPALSMVVLWPELLSVEFSMPLFVLIAILFVAGFVVTSLPYLVEHRRLKRSVAETKREVMGLEHERRPEPEPEPEPDSTLETSEPEEQQENSLGTSLRGAAADISSSETSTLTLQPLMESTVEKKTTSESEDNVLAENTEQASAENTAASSLEVQEGTPESTQYPHATDASENRSRFKEDEVLERPSAPGWGAVLLLSAALALVVSSGVYIVLNTQITQLSEQLGDLHMQSGHMASTQEEMGRIWERERVTVRDDLESLGQSQKQLDAGIETLEEQMQALQALPEIFRKRLVAGFLQDTASKTAYLSTQVETDEQRETLERVEEMLKSLAQELENAGDGR